MEVRTPEEFRIFLSSMDDGSTIEVGELSFSGPWLKKRKFESLQARLREEGYSVSMRLRFTKITLTVQLAGIKNYDLKRILNIVDSYHGG